MYFESVTEIVYEFFTPLITKQEGPINLTKTTSISPGFKTVRRNCCNSESRKIQSKPALLADCSGSRQDILRTDFDINFDVSNIILVSIFFSKPQNNAKSPPSKNHGKINKPTNFVCQKSFYPERKIILQI